MADIERGGTTQTLECPTCGFVHRPAERDEDGSGGKNCPECGESTARVIA